jgi:hypothetical protein
MSEHFSAKMEIHKIGTWFRSSGGKSVSNALPLELGAAIIMGGALPTGVWGTGKGPGVPGVPGVPGAVGNGPMVILRGVTGVAIVVAGFMIVGDLGSASSGENDAADDSDVSIGGGDGESSRAAASAAALAAAALALAEIRPVLPLFLPGAMTATSLKFVKLKRPREKRSEGHS